MRKGTFHTQDAKIVKMRIVFAIKNLNSDIFNKPESLNAK